MYIIKFKENCKAIKARLQQKYSNITDEDLLCCDGRNEEMMERLQQKLGKTRDELGKIIRDLSIQM